MNRYIILLAIAVITLASCSKNKKHCWKCSFDRGMGFKALDTTACDMTDEESKIWQQKTAERQIKDYGQPSSSPGSWCHKSSK